MLGHFSNDLLSGILPVLFPVMKIQFGTTNAELGLIALVFTSTSSLTQPLFGYFSDTHGRRWFIPLTLVWGAVCASLYGLVPSYTAVFILAALAGIGSGAFTRWEPLTPQPSLPVGTVTPPCPGIPSREAPDTDWDHCLPSCCSRSSVRRGRCSC